MECLVDMSVFTILECIRLHLYTLLIIHENIIFPIKETEDLSLKISNNLSFF